MRAPWSTLRGFGVTEEKISQLDLYSCFPTVVQTACEVLGIDAFDPTRVPSLTGGLTFAGGPGNNYVTHSIATMVDTLRTNPNDTGLVTALGWFSTKHAWGTYSTTPPKNGFRWRDAQGDVDHQPRCVSDDLEGSVSIESYTVSHARTLARARPTDSSRRCVPVTRHASGATVPMRP